MAHTPTAAVYGFIGWVLSIFTLLSFLLWAFVTDRQLSDTLGITYFPDKLWALRFSSLIAMTFVIYVVMYVGCSMSQLPALDDPVSLGPLPCKKGHMDGCMTCASCPNHRLEAPNAVPPLLEIPLCVVNKEIIFTKKSGWEKGIS